VVEKTLPNPSAASDIIYVDVFKQVFYAIKP